MQRSSSSSIGSRLGYRGDSEGDCGDAGSPTKAWQTSETLRLLDPRNHLQLLYFFPLEDFLPDLEILKPPDEPGPRCRALFIWGSKTRLSARLHRHLGMDAPR